MASPANFADTVMVEHSRKPARSAATGSAGEQPRPGHGSERAETEDDAQDARRRPPFSEGIDPRYFAMPSGADATGLRDMFALVRGNVLLILFMVLLSLGAGTAYLAYAPPRYIASATLLVDPSSSSIPEEYYIESQTQMMRSDLVVRAVIEELDLVEAGIEQDDRTLLRDHVQVAKQLVGEYAGEYVPALAFAPEEGDPVQGAVLTLRRNLNISRPAMTPVISISYNSTDPGRAADIVNTLVHTYTSQRRRDETTATRQSIEWLAQRLEELRQQLENAERSAESFRTANNIVGTGANHNLQAEQRLYELNVRLEVARAAVERARARHRGTQIMSEGLSGAPAGRAPTGREIAMLSARETAAEHGLTGFRLDLETDALGPISPTTELPGSDEDARAHGDELADALAKLASLEEAFNEAAGRAGEVNRQRTQLRELEASAEIYRTLHGGMLQRYEEAVQQGTLPVNDGAQVLIAARRPDSRSHPRPLLVFAFAGAFGIALGVGAAALRARPSSDAAAGK